jgi:hypothetical protein
MAPPIMITSIDIKKVRRGRWYPRIWVHGFNFPPVPAPISSIRATHLASGTASNFTNFLIYGPELLYIWGTVPRYAPRGMYSISYCENNIPISTITNAFRVT